MSEPTEVTGVPWYDASTYGRILEIMEDACLLPDTYEKWHRGATDLVARAQQKGELAVKIRIDPSHFQTWCQVQGYAADVQARMEFAQWAAQEQSAERYLL
jgi:hypothetical protein